MSPPWLNGGGAENLHPTGLRNSRTADTCVAIAKLIGSQRIANEQVAGHLWQLFRCARRLAPPQSGGPSHDCWRARSANRLMRRPTSIFACWSAIRWSSTYVILKPQDLASCSNRATGTHSRVSVRSIFRWSSTLSVRWPSPRTTPRTCQSQRPIRSMTACCPSMRPGDADEDHPHRQLP